MTSFPLYSKGRICEGSDMRGSDMRGSTVFLNSIDNIFIQCNLFLEFRTHSGLSVLVS